MIEIISKIHDKPYIKFYKYLDMAAKSKQNAIEAIAVSSYDTNYSEVDSRYVNLKFIDEDKWTFFTNYNSKKAKQFENFNQISSILYWDNINLQIRMKAKIYKCSNEVSNTHYRRRDKMKNALARSSKQSFKVASYEKVIENYKKELDIDSMNGKRPAYWGGYYFTPYYFEFWEGNISRINKRKVYCRKNQTWDEFYLEP